MGQILQKLLDVFYTKNLDIVVIGLENRCAGFFVCIIDSSLIASCVVVFRARRTVIVGEKNPRSFRWQSLRGYFRA